jgi:hypothetical protein
LQRGHLPCDILFLVKHDAQIPLFLALMPVLMLTLFLVRKLVIGLFVLQLQHILKSMPLCVDS